MMAFSPARTQHVCELVRSTGRDADCFTALVDHRGFVCVRSENAVVVYLHEGWTHKFVNHLQRGYFDRPLDPGERPKRA